MYRILGSGLGFCIVFAAALGLEVRADAIQMTMTGNAGFGPVNYTQVLSNSVLETGFSDLTLGSRTVGAIPSGSIDAPISLTIGLSDLDHRAPGSDAIPIRNAHGAVYPVQPQLWHPRDQPAFAGRGRPRARAAPIAILGLATIAYLFKRARSAKTPGAAPSALAK